MVAHGIIVTASVQKIEFVTLDSDFGLRHSGLWASDLGLRLVNFAELVPRP